MDPGKLADLAIEAEDAGWDGFFIWDIVFAGNEAPVPVVDPWIALAAIAARTKRIKFGAFLTPLPRRRPWQVARATVALDLYRMAESFLVRPWVITHVILQPLEKILR